MIEPAHFCIGVCKAVDLELSGLLDAADPEWKVAEEQIAADLSEVKEAMASVGLSPVKLRRALRTELGRMPETAERPLHRSPALRKIFKQAAALASADGGRLRPAHLVVALIESGDSVVSAAVTKLGHDSFAVLLGFGEDLRRKISRPKTARLSSPNAQEKRKKDARRHWRRIGEILEGGTERDAPATVWRKDAPATVATHAKKPLAWIERS